MNDPLRIGLHGAPGRELESVGQLDRRLEIGRGEVRVVVPVRGARGVGDAVADLEEGEAESELIARVGLQQAAINEARLEGVAEEIAIRSCESGARKNAEAIARRARRCI